MPSTEKDVYRLIPYRFFVNQEDTDVCKLEKLTNLFPEMKDIIELELFKFNNLRQMLDRLSRIYPISTVIDTRDDTYHVFLGPYHLSLGPAIFGAMHFKNISTALMINNPAYNRQKSRTDLNLRRFRRAVRKLILIKSIVDKLRLASVLTPCNQHELYTQGIYDLVLAGHLRSPEAISSNDAFPPMNTADKETSFTASKYMKVSALLHLISPTPHQPSGSIIPETSTSPESGLSHPMAPNATAAAALLDSMCCSHHCPDVPLLRFAARRSISVQGTQFEPSESHTHHRSTHCHPSCRSPVPHPRSTAASLPDLSVNTTVEPNPPLTAPPAPTDADGEDALISKISTLLSNYVNVQQSKASSPPTDFDQLLASIKTRVNEALAEKRKTHFQPVHKPSKTIARNPRRKLFSVRSSSLQETSVDEFAEEHFKPTVSKLRADVSVKSQSCDELDLSKGQADRVSQSFTCIEQS